MAMFILICVRKVKNIWNLLASPFLVATLILSATSVAAETVVTSEKTEEETLGQVTSVSQFSDVQPTDWAFQSLQSLVERYGCIAGYPNGTFRGNRALTRYEFAAGLNACLNRINELIDAGNSNAGGEDLSTIKRLQSEFSSELATLRGRVDAVEAKTAQLEASQFSTTSKLEGEVVIAVTDVFEGNTTNKNTTLGTRARINFVTSFTGKDTLYTRIQANNIPDVDEAPLAFAGDEDTNAYLDGLYYSFPLTKSTNVIAIANAGAADDLVDTVNQFDGDGAEGALSSFGTRNFIYYQMDGSGLGITQELGDISVSLGYLASSNNDPSPGNGLFEGSYGALAQLTLEPSKRFKVGLTYINGYDEPNQTTNDSYGVQATLGLSDKLVLGGWGGYSNIRDVNSSVDADIWSWAVTLGLPDLGKKGNTAGVIFGMNPKVTDSNIPGFTKQDSSYHIEGFYQHKVNDNISITPGVIWVTAPGNDSDNDDAIVGTLRTTFIF